MRTLLLLLALCILPSTVLAQSVLVKWGWTQPDSTQAVTVTLPGGETYDVPGFPIQDGGLGQYNVYMATLTDTSTVAIVPAPFAIADTAFVTLPIPLQVLTSIAVEAIDTGGQIGLLSEWSDPIMILPGPPQAGGQPVVKEVILGE